MWTNQVKNYRTFNNLGQTDFSPFNSMVQIKPSGRLTNSANFDYLNVNDFDLFR